MNSVNRSIGVLFGVVAGIFLLTGLTGAAHAQAGVSPVDVALCPACEEATSALVAKREEMSAYLKEKRDEERAELDELKNTDIKKFREVMAARRVKKNNRKMGDVKQKLTKEQRSAQRATLQAEDPDLYQIQNDLRELAMAKKECEKTCPAK